jgi:perosamine synthetase
MEALTWICRDLNIALIEDATEALGSLYRGRPCGGLSRIGVLSFNGNKVVTTGGGGAIVTNDKNLAARAKTLRRAQNT